MEYSKNCIHSYRKFHCHEHLIILQKDFQREEEVVNSALQKISENEAKELKIHFVYAYHYDWLYDHGGIARSFIMNGMKKHKIKSVMVTNIQMHREYLITKEKMESYCNGEEFEKNSVNDDLETLFENIRLGKEPDEEVQTYFLPKLTEEEMELVERRDTSYLQGLYEGLMGGNPDVNETEMMLSESDSKYVYGFSQRRTFGIQISSEYSSECLSEYPPEKQSCLKNCCSLQ